MNTYHEAYEKNYTLKIRELLKDLPMICASFFRSIETTTSVLTRYGYAIDLKNFFTYITSDEGLVPGKEIKNLAAEDLSLVRAIHIESYLEYETYYIGADGKELSNKENGKARKLASLRSFFKYCFKNEIIPSNPTELVSTPKIHEKAIIRLEAHEIANLLDLVEDGDGLTRGQKKYHELTQVRDLAIITLLLGTGIRVSELVGLDLRDIDIENFSFIVTRKGGKQAILAFNEETAEALAAYLAARDEIIPLEGHETALFLSLQRRRITTRAVENLVKKYASAAAPLKKISPHKLRSTYGTMLYRETQDIYLVADVLGHKDVNTTRKHYAAQPEDNARRAANSIKLRQD